MAQQFGVVGLGVMGDNLALNIEEHGFSVAVYDRDPAVVDRWLQRSAGKRVIGTRSPAEFAAALERPRRILVMVKAGAPVDSTIATLQPHLQPGDLIVDGGNEFFRTTERRANDLEKAGFRFVGMGVSGGQEGARNGPSLMPGGDRSAYDELAPILTRIAAQVDDGPCVDYIGPGGSGHYVKMVHNGIEYGDMQLIAEVYDLLSTVGGLGPDEMSTVFDEWNHSELQSFLIEITAQIFRKRDDETGRPLVDMVLDATGMKGTGQWTVVNAAELGAPIPTIAAALDARIYAANKAERVAAAKLLRGPQLSGSVNRKQLVEDLRHALYASKICSYAQGLNLLRVASQSYNWNLALGRIARLWKGGCIIRAQFLDHIAASFRRTPDLANLLVDSEFARDLGTREAGWRRALALAVAAGVAMPAMSASLAYFDSYRRERLPANLTQAQRDLFGAHTFQRTDRAGTFHVRWTE